MLRQAYNLRAIEDQCSRLAGSHILNDGMLLVRFDDWKL